MQSTSTEISFKWILILLIFIIMSISTLADWTESTIRNSQTDVSTGLQSLNTDGEGGAGKFTATENYTITNISIYYSSVSGSPTLNLSIWSNDGANSKPSSVLKSIEVKSSDSTGWRNYSTSDGYDIIKGTSYWVAIITPDAGTESASYIINGVAGGGDTYSYTENNGASWVNGYDYQMGYIIYGINESAVVDTTNPLVYNLYPINKYIPIVHYNLDGVNNTNIAIDERGNHNGTVHEATNTTDRFDVTNHALSFDGENNYVFIENSLGELIRDENISISLWAKYTGHTGSIQNIFSHPYTTGTYGNRYYLSFSANSALLDVRVGNTSFDNIYDFGDSAWHHVTLANVWNKTFTLYVDGLLIGTSKTTQDEGSNDIYVGAFSAISQRFNGSIDDVRIYDKAISEEMIKKIYYESSYANITRNYDMDWFNNGTNAIIIDEAGLGNGTIINATNTTDRFGNENSALDFDGVDDYVNINNSVFENFNTTNYSVSLWFYHENVVTTNVFNEQQTLFTTKIVSTYPYIYLTLRNSYYQLRYINASDDYTIFKPQQAGEWNNIVSVFQEGSILLYFNGEYFDTETDGNLPLNLGRTDLWLGHGGGLAYFNGSIDDVKIYNRALSSLEIESLYYENSYNNKIIENYKIGENITISCNVTDDTAVSTVVANISLSNGTIKQETLNQVEATEQYNTTYILPKLVGFYNITIIATDSSDNVNDTEFVEINVSGFGYSGRVISYYNFSGTTNDEIGPNDLTNNGADTGAEGYLDQTYQYLKSNGDYMTDASATLNIESDLTIIFFTLINQTEPSDLMYLVEISKDVQNDNTIHIFHDVDDTIAITCSVGGDQVCGKASNITISDEQYYMIAVTYNGTDYELYINNVHVGNQEANVSDYSGFNIIDVGRYHSDSNETKLYGKIDELLISNEAFTKSEIIDIYDNYFSKGVSPIEESPSDSCSYGGSGTWEIDCSDNCTIDENYDLTENNIVITSSGGEGIIKLTSNISNYNLSIKGESASKQCILSIQGGNLQ